MTARNPLIINDGVLQEMPVGDHVAASYLSPALLKADNLSGLANVATARSNLGLGALAVLSSLAVADITGLSAALAARIEVVSGVAGISSASAFLPHFVLTNSANDGTAGYLILQKKRGSNIVQDGDALGTLIFQGYDGVSLQNVAWIQSIVYGTPGAGDMPTALQFFTTPDGGLSTALALTLRSNQSALFQGNIEIEKSGTTTASITALNSTGTVAMYMANSYAVVGTMTADDLLLVYNNAEKARVHSAGFNVTGTLDVTANILVQDAGYFYTPYNGGSHTGTVRAGIQVDGTNNGINFYITNTYRGGIDANGALVITTSDIMVARSSTTTASFRAYNGTGDVVLEMHNGYGAVGAATADDFLLLYNNAERARVVSTGFTVTGDLSVSGGISPGATSNWYVSMHTDGPLLNFDNNDFYLYHRSSNEHRLSVGGTYRVVVSAAGLAVTGTVDLTKQSAPSAPSSNHGLLYLTDNIGTGKLELRVRFPTGSAQLIASEP